MPARNEMFGRLLKAGIGSIAMCEGKNAVVVEEELGQKLRLSGDSVQRYKAGHIPPEPRTVEILAEAAVRRGYMSREWLQRFLQAARHPISDRLLNQLCPVVPTPQRPPRIYENLPSPPYSQFVMRPQAYSDITDGLDQRSAVVLIHGLSGNGKTSLAREVAARCLKEDFGILRFDAVIWVSDKDRPGTTNLSVVLDEIARVLDYPGFTQFEHDEKCYEVEQLLRRLRVLLVVDNFETITDGALLTWMLRLPEPSKAIITTREYRREYRSSWPVELKGMSATEAWELIQQRLRLLRIQHLVDDATQLEHLIEVTGGNPKAIEVSLGLVKYERCPIQQVVNDLHKAQSELFDELFARAWNLLKEVERRVLLAMPLFSTSASNDAIAAVSDVQGFVLEQTIERLSDLALLDVRQQNLSSQPRYAVHPLVRAFAEAQPNQKFAMKQRERWVKWCIDLVEPVGYCWQDLGKLNLLDNDEETILSALKWSFECKRYKETLQIARGFEYYYFVRGIWRDKLEVDLIRAEAARSYGSIEEEVIARSSFVRVLSLDRKTEEAAAQLSRLNELIEHEVSGDALYVYWNALATYYQATNQEDKEEQFLQKAMEFSGESTIPRQINACASLADYRYRKGALSEAKRLFHTALRTAIDHNYERIIAVCGLRLAEINLAQQNLEAAEEGLATSLERANTYNDLRCIAEVQLAWAQLHTLHDDYLSAYNALQEAVDRFERLGMRYALAKTQTRLSEVHARLYEAAD